MLVMLASCQSRSDDKPYLGTWVQLTKQNGAYVIFQPCGLDNRLMRISEQSVYELLPSEENKSTLQDIKPEGEGYVLNGKSGSRYVFTWENKAKGIAVWKIAHAASDPVSEIVFVDSLHMHDFKTVKEKGCEGELSEEAGTINELLRPLVSDYTVAQTAKGDANNDGIEDQLVILNHKSEQDPELYESLIRNDTEGVNRPAILFLGQGGGKFQLTFRNDKLIPSKLFSQNERQVSYEQVSVNKGNIQFTTIEDPRGGGTILRKVKYSFSYNAAEKSWSLKQAEISYIPYKQKPDTHVFAADKLGGPKAIRDFNVYQFSPAKYVNNESNSFFMK
ncbi:hypothetical protein DN068_07630 [Taibaiella soli]|uniref:Uncharacterized protein n=2 Tax=Taibaiella soli TaxID=1649169 RepID=A0A2W2B008_9BACT|nr:hypothetical protein DN068_07630 [Taibaiella soli]